MKKVVVDKILAAQIAISMYIGEKCLCGESFDTLESLDDAVFWPRGENRIGHKDCWIKAGSPEKKSKGNES